MNISPARNLAPVLALLVAAIAYGSPGEAAGETAPSAASTNPTAMTSEEGSYLVGLMLGSQLEHDGVVPIMSVDTLIRGLRDATGGRPVTVAERDAARRFMRDARASLVDKNRAAARQFLEHNGKQPGIQARPSGLQYRVLAEGDRNGKSPTLTDEVTVRYRATLADGKEFDRSELHERPATFRVNSVFKGWQEAFLSMKPGAKWQLFVPPELGYGANSPPAVPPGALLVYELELLHIEPATAMDPAAVSHRPATVAKPATPRQ